MVKNILLGLVIIFLLHISLSGQHSSNITLLGQLEYSQGNNDIWGYEDDDGTMLALVGTKTGISIVDISNPSAPVKKIFIEGSRSIWRDIKTWGHYAYVVSDLTNDGLLIIDLSTVLSGLTEYKYTNIEFSYSVTDSVQFNLESCHNLYIDEEGFLYLAGCNIVQGAIIYDLKNDPMNPEFVGAENRSYFHDVFVRDNLMFGSEIYTGKMGIYDVTDKTDIKKLSSSNTSGFFTHNIWTSDGNKYAYTTDEIANAFVDIFDITDLRNVKRVSKFQPKATVSKGVIPHNTHYKNDYLITSWYTDGVIVTDVSHPDNVVEVGNYDTWTGGHGGFNGCWGAYPFFKNDIILASDISNGLFILQPEYKRASYIEGTVLNKISGEKINNAKIAIEVDQSNEVSSLADGTFKTGIVGEGQFTLKVDHPSYELYEESVDLVSGEVQNIEVALTKKSTTSVSETDKVVLQIFPNPFTENIQVKSDKSIVSYTINDILGRTMMESSYPRTTKNLSIDASTLSKGTYILELMDANNEKIVKKIVKIN